MLKLSDQEFKTTIPSLRVLMDEVDSMQEGTCNVSRKMKILKTNQNKCQKSKSLTETRNNFDGLISRLHG